MPKNSKNNKNNNKNNNSKVKPSGSININANSDNIYVHASGRVEKTKNDITIYGQADVIRNQNLHGHGGHNDFKIEGGIKWNF